MEKTLRPPAAGELGIAILVVAIISLMILPLPPAMIDVLLAINITISVTLLMVTMYISNIISLSSFPSLLLFTTLYRLSLNIASTKSILLHADAGHIIESFGELVVGGNLVVGLVVFVIITTVQFIVIAKGSERVAEVGARFTLDALPGKQMSIDADLRANAINADEARRRRAALAMESKLHGGMDGAMKFVKGDAIAGLIITMINIFAGIAVGVMYHGMTAGEAASRFSVLSIGDAMVSQIPSLLISVSAGVIITRVSDEINPRQADSLGDEISRQVGGNARALYLAALLLLGFALVPGFPSALFVILSAILALAAYRLSARGTHARSASQGAALPDPAPALQRPGGKSDTPAILSRAPQFTCPIGVRMAADLVPRLSSKRLDQSFDTERALLQEELGLPFPGITMWCTDVLPSATYEILIYDVPYGQNKIEPGKNMRAPEASPVQSSLASRESSAEPAFLSGEWVDAGKATDQKGVFHAEQLIAHHVIHLMRAHASLFVGIQETQWILEKVNDEYPGLVAEVQKILPPQRIAEVLRRLLEEGISIRNIRNILESLINWGPKEKDLLMLTEYVRGDLARFMAHHAAGGERQLPVVLLDLSVEQLLRQSIKQTPTGNYLALPPDQINQLIDKIIAMTEDSARTHIAVVTSMDIRRYVRRMIEGRLAWLPVYSYQELGNHVELQPLGKVTM